MFCFPPLSRTLLIFFCQLLDRKSLIFVFSKTGDPILFFCIVNPKNTSNAAERFVASRSPVCQASSCWSVWGTRRRFTMWRGISSTLKSHSKFLKCTGLFHLFRVCLELWLGFFVLFRKDRFLSFFTLPFSVETTTYLSRSLLACFFSDSKQAASAGADQAVRLWSLLPGVISSSLGPAFHSDKG